MKTITKLEGTPLSEKEVAEKFQVDTDLRYPDKLETSAYEGQQKDPEGNPVILTLYRTFVNWKLKHPLLEEEHLKALREILQGEIPPLTDLKEKIDGDILALLLHTDKHIDRIEHDKRYLNQINERTQNLMHKIKGWDIDQFVYADLGDMYNSNTNYKTLNQTQQQNNTTEAEAFKIGMTNELQLLKKMEEEFGRVDAVYVPGNHDRSKQNWMAQALNLYFTNNPNVSIDDRNLARKYIEYGKNTIGLQHGHLVPWNRALETYTSEQKLRDYNYLLQGHIHHEKSKQFGKLIVEALGSPARPSEWERDNGYNTRGNIKAMLFDKKKGRVATLEG